MTTQKKVKTTNHVLLTCDSGVSWFDFFHYDISHHHALILDQF